MDLILPFISSFASYLIISYFIYSILGRKRTISLIILGVIFVSAMFDWLGVLRSNAENSIIILYFMVRVLPVIFAGYLFMVVTGGAPLLKLKMKRTSIKGISSDIQTKKLSTQIGYLMIGGSLVFGILAYFYIVNYMKWFIIVVLMCALIFGVYMLINNMKIVSESIILIVGKHREKVYAYEIDKTLSKIVVSDFFKNENYIVDPIGIAILIDENKRIEKHYLFWIATGDQIDMTDEPVHMIPKLNYHDHLEKYEKYHYRALTFEIGKAGNAELIKNKKIK